MPFFTCTVDVEGLVDGHSFVPAPTVALSVRTTDYTRAVPKKILFGDWNFHANRTANLKAGEWHNYGGVKRHNMAFADGHSEFFEFPPGFESLPAATIPDPDVRTYW